VCVERFGRLNFTINSIKYGAEISLFMKSLSISLVNMQLRDAVEGSNFQPQFLQQGFSLFYQRSKSKIACRVQFGQ
jgi:hypothetical protein